MEFEAANKQGVPCERVQEPERVRRPRTTRPVRASPPSLLRTGGWRRMMAPGSGNRVVAGRWLWRVLLTFIVVVQHWCSLSPDETPDETLLLPNPGCSSSSSTQVYEREAIMGRDASSVFPTETVAAANAAGLASAVQEGMGAVKFVTESQVPTPPTRQSSRKLPSA
jgi:hypothetical protein